MRSTVKRVGLGALLVSVVAACGDDERAVHFSTLGPEVEEDGWVEAPHTLEGDGATSFESYGAGNRGDGPVVQGLRPFFLPNYGVDAGATTMVIGDHLLSSSPLRGLVSTRLTGADAPQVDSMVPMAGWPVGFFVSDGVAAVIVVDALDPVCFYSPCLAPQTSRVVLVDVQDMTHLALLGELRFDGTVSAARLSGGSLHVLTRTIEICPSCDSIPADSMNWLEFDRRAPRELLAPRVTTLPGRASFEGEWLFVLSPGAVWGDGPSEMRVAKLTGPEPELSPPVAIIGGVGQFYVSGDRLRVSYGSTVLDLETFALDGGSAPVSLGRAQLELPEDISNWGLRFEGDRAIALLGQSGLLGVFDLSDPTAPRIASQLALDLSEGTVTLAGDRVLAMGHSTLAADAAVGDSIASGPQALVLVDLADAAAPRVVDRVSLGSFDSVQTSDPELRGDQALASYYDVFLGGDVPDGNECGRTNRHLVGYDLASGRLAPAFAFDGLDADAHAEAIGSDWWLASSFSVSRYQPGSGGTPVARAELTQSLDSLRALSTDLALFGVDLESSAATLDLVPRSQPVPASLPSGLDVAATAGLPRVDCEERRQWSDPVFEHEGKVYALRFHALPGDAGAPAATLHVVDSLAAAGAPSPSLSMDLEPLAQGEEYLGAVQVGQALLVARGRPSAAPPGAEASVFHAVSDPTSFQDDIGAAVYEYGMGEGMNSAAHLGYDVYDLGAAAAPVRAAHVDIAPELTTGGFFRSLRGVTRDTGWGFQQEQQATGPVVVSGSLLTGQHSELISDGRAHFYLDRFDFADPAAPRALESIPIPGSVLDFDAATGGLLTLETVWPPPAAGSPSHCGPGYPTACVSRRVINGLVVDGAQATRVGRLMLDGDERKIGRFAVSHGNVYYTTQLAGLGGVEGGPFGAREVSIERLSLRDGRLERSPSLDVGSASDVSPSNWEQFAAQGERVFWVAGSQLLVADFSGEEPVIEAHDLGPWGCRALEVRDGTAYCAQGQAGYVSITLGTP